MKLLLLRNATLVLTINDKNILIDPMLAPKGSYDPLPNTASSLRNPLVDLPISESELRQLVRITDAVLLTHLHTDHWDPNAQQVLPKSLPLLCQPANAGAIHDQGFSNVMPVEKEYIWEGIRITRTGGRHGVGEIGENMGIVSGYIIEHAGTTLYLAGDTIWCTEVQQALDNFKPSLVVVNASAARFVVGDPIVMTAADVVAVCRYAPQAKVYVTHLEAVNNSTESRAETRAAIANAGLSYRCFVPDDGEFLF